ncbi:MAG: hypothetical protein HQ472_08670 [Ignavibacteria bacterium]|nr:hypothetical protein [Ignavibacteria bacterium]
MHRKILVFVVVASLTTWYSELNAQVRFRAAAGLSTDWITNDNAATKRLSNSEDSVNFDAPFGGGFDGMQIGYGVKFYADLDKQKIIRIPIGVDVFSYSGAQALNGNTYTYNVRHENTIVSTMIGFEYSFIEFPLAFARAFAGAEIRPMYVGANVIRSVANTLVNGVWVPTIDRSANGKESAWRVGGMLRLGIEGEILYPVFLNTSVAYGVMNLLGRDTRTTSEGGRGELLTPFAKNEGSEQYIHHVNFTFMIQVRL